MQRGARRIGGPKDRVEAFLQASKGHMAQDHDGDPADMTRLRWDNDRVVSDWPEVKLCAAKEACV